MAKTIKKAKNGGNEPDYRFIKKNATAKDSADYRAGFERGMKGENKWFPSRSNKAGSVEAKRRGLKNTMQAGGVVSKKVKAPMVDPKGAWTKVQQRNLPPAPMKKGGKIAKKK